MPAKTDALSQFERRKRDHIELALKPENQVNSTGLEHIQLIHEALPDINFSEISIEVKSLGENCKSPFIVSSMTAGHKDAVAINRTMAEACAEKHWSMGVGSQRRQLDDPQAAKEWQQVLKNLPDVTLFANLGIAQVITTSTDTIKRLCDSLNARGLFIHLNALQECIQPEGTLDFKDGAKAIANLCKHLDCPVIVKETGCGFSEKTLKRLDTLGIAAVDLSGFGGTHWGRIEGDRATDTLHKTAAETFSDWGINTVSSMINALCVKPSYEIWASGGIRTGLDAAKLLAMGAIRIGLAKPILAAALQGIAAVVAVMEQMEFELKVAMFCTGQKTIPALWEGQVWQYLR